jgi:hypothetical protein
MSEVGAVIITKNFFSFPQPSFLHVPSLDEAYASKFGFEFISRKMKNFIYF